MPPPKFPNPFLQTPPQPPSPPHEIPPNVGVQPANPPPFQGGFMRPPNLKPYTPPPGTVAPEGLFLAEPGKPVPDPSGTGFWTWEGFGHEPQYTGPGTPAGPELPTPPTPPAPNQPARPSPANPPMVEGPDGVWR